MNLTTDQKIVCVPVFAQILIEFIEDTKSEYPAVYRHGLKKAANDLISESTQLMEIVYGSFGKDQESLQQKLKVSEDQVTLATAIKNAIADGLIV